jgi:Flp pilus assembly protein TadG
MSAFTRKMLASRAARFFRLNVARRFVRKNDGAAAVEFGLVAAPFLALLFAIIETSFVLFAGQTLETATADSARLIMTGQAQEQGFSEAKFKEEVCKRIFGLFNCADKMQIDVRKYSTFASVDSAKPTIGEDGKVVGAFGYNPGGPGEIVVVRMMYPFPVYLSLKGWNPADSGGYRLVMATSAFRNEPYK